MTKDENGFSEGRPWEIVYDAHTSPEKFQSAMEELGFERAMHLRRELSLSRGMSVHIVTSIQDADGFAKGFARELRANQVEVSIGTYWLSTRVLSTSPWLDDAHVVMRYCEDEVRPDSILVAVNSLMGAVSGVSAMILDASETATFNHIRVATAISYIGSEELLRRELSSDDARRIRFLPYRSAYGVNDDGTPRHGIQSDLASKHGIGVGTTGFLTFPFDADNAHWPRGGTQRKGTDGP